MSIDIDEILAKHNIQLPIPPDKIVDIYIDCCSNENGMH